LSSSYLKRLIPVNRHVVVIPHIKQKETPTGVLLPEDYKPEEDRYVEATVVSVSEDCSDHIRRHWLSTTAASETKVVIDKTMLEEITVNDKTYYMILENYIVGFFSGF